MDANRRLHDMHDDIAEVHQHPFTVLFAFDRNDLAAGFAHLFLDVAGERLHLAIGIAGGDDDAVEQGGELGGVEDFDVAALDVLEGGYDQFLQLFKIHRWSKRG